MSDKSTIDEPEPNSDHRDPNAPMEPPPTTSGHVVRTLQSSGPLAREGRARGPVEGDTVEFLFANRRSLRSSDGRKRAREHADDVIESLRTSFDVSSTCFQPEAEGRIITRFRGSYDELRAKIEDVDHEHVLLDHLVPRHTAVGLHPLIATLAAHARGSNTGTGTRLSFTIRANGNPVAGARVLFYAVDRAKNATELVLFSDGEGRVSANYAEGLTPAAAQIEPSGGAWGAVISSPKNGEVYELPPLVLEGPLAWWHLLVGKEAWTDNAGTGIKIGVADTGVGPHPFLDHVIRIGAFVDGRHDTSPSATNDISNHGSHVCGAIGARPGVGSRGYGGIAAGAELYCARVFNGKTATNADTAAAIDEFGDFYEVDLVNLSLGGPPSAIEADAILHAFEQGTLCICAAGNQYGAAVSSPASLPYTAAVSALGLTGQAPSGSLSASNVPTQPDMFTHNGLFLTKFSNIGSQVTVASPGNGIISTVPTTEFDSAPYTPLDGTSMASPIAVGALAVLLSNSERYRGLERGVDRSNFAIGALIQAAKNIGLQAKYQGHGLTRDGL